MTLTEKILTAHMINRQRSDVRPGDIIRIRVDWTMASELALNSMFVSYEQMGKPAIADHEKFYLTIDHTVDPVTCIQDPHVRKMVRLAQTFAATNKLKHFYDTNTTILHTKFYRDLVQPGEIVLGADSHTTSHGGLGAFAIGLGGADITAAMVLGETWIEVPEAIAVEYRGKPPFGITGKDIILRTLKIIGRNKNALERSVEYIGESVKSFSTDMRFTIANMTAELGGLNGIFEPDAVVENWLAQRQAYNGKAVYFRADPDADYVERSIVDLENLSPQIAEPFSPDKVVDIEKAIGVRFDGCFMGACTTTEEEFILAGMVLETLLAKGIRFENNKKRLMVPGDLAIAQKLHETGLAHVYEKAGFRILVPGCHLCLGLGSEKAGEGEVWLSSQNRNFKNRMGKGVVTWLSSAPVIAASAADLRLRDPRPCFQDMDLERYEKILKQKSPLRSVKNNIDDMDSAGFQDDNKTDIKIPGVGTLVAESSRDKIITGRVQRFGDHIDTDAIIPAEFCHLADWSALGLKCFIYERPEFVSYCRSGRSIVVAGEGWGCGSSREHAVWALIGAGVKAVIAKSISFIHKRNLANEALPFFIVKDETFYERIDENDLLFLDLEKNIITHQESGEAFKAQNANPVIQVLAAAGGIVGGIKNHGKFLFERAAPSEK